MLVRDFSQLLHANWRSKAFDLEKISGEICDSGDFDATDFSRLLRFSWIFKEYGWEEIF